MLSQTTGHMRTLLKYSTAPSLKTMAVVKRSVWLAYKESILRLVGLTAELLAMHA